MKGSLKTVSIPDNEENDPMVFLGKHKGNITDRLKKEVEEGGVKWSIQVQFKKEQKEETVIPHFRGKYQIALKAEDIEMGFQDSVKKIHQSFSDYQRQGSNWIQDHTEDRSCHARDRME